MARTPQKPPVKSEAKPASKALRTGKATTGISRQHDEAPRVSRRNQDYSDVTQAHRSAYVRIG